jgi:hypothetical protein
MKNPNHQYCIVLPANKIQQACDVVSGFGSGWVTGWKDGQSWVDDQVTATKIVLLFGCNMEVVQRP